jgi:alcohol dehydrogenase (cytochrome c)
VVDVCGTFKKLESDFKESLPYWGGDAQVSPQQVHGGEVRAIDPATGQMVSEWPAPHPIVASLLTTAGGLVFVGEPTGEFKALNARSGAVLWNFQTGSGIHSNPVTYSVNGRQYIAVASGWGGWMKGFAPELYGATRGGAW